jgi:plasmid stabilization system protein ParE
MTISLRHGISLRWCTAHPQLPATLPEAEEQLAKLYRYIADHASPEIAQRYTSAIIDYCDGMQTVPHRGTCRDDVRPGLRVTHYRGRAIILRRGSLTLLPRSRLAAMRHQRISTGIGRNSQNASVTGRASAAPERTALYTSRAPHGGSSGRPALL